MDTNTSVASRQRATQGAGGIAGDLMRGIMAFLGDGEIVFRTLTTAGTGANLQLLPDVDRVMPSLTLTASSTNMATRCSPPAAMAQRNSTASEPSRITAAIVTINKAASGRLPICTSALTADSSAASSRPCALIQTVCQVSISTALNKITAFMTAWPLPE